MFAPGDLVYLSTTLQNQVIITLAGQPSCFGWNPETLSGCRPKTCRYDEREFGH